jgi:hypothetical protein
MPGDLTDPESYQPFHYDRRYPWTQNTFEPGIPDVDSNIQGIALKTTGAKLSAEKLKLLKSWLQSEGYLSRNSGDPAFEKKVVSLIDKLKMAKRVVNGHRSEFAYI